MLTLNQAKLLETPKALDTTKVTIQEMSPMEGEMDNQQLTLVELGWLAGIIDGEGYIGVTKAYDTRTRRVDNTVQVQLHISNCDEAIILRARDVMRKLGINPYIRACNSRNRKARDHYRIQVKHMGKMVKLLTPLVPHLTGNTKKRAELVLEFCESRFNQVPEAMPKVRNGGRKNSGTCKPLTERQWEILEECGKLSARGSSETVRLAARKKSEIRKQKRVRKIIRNMFEGQPSRAEGIVQL